jgi:tRNA (mo5U34)-methyltransferase
MDVYDLSPEKVGVFDVVLFLGVFYHLSHPLLGLERVASVTGDLLIPETHEDLLDHRRPAMAFYPGGELGYDVTNWWGPNGPALLGLLRTVGFQRLKVVNPPTAKVLCIGRRVRSTTCSRRGTASTTPSAGGA